MGINKVIYYGEVLVDMSQVTVTPETLSEGETALDARGELITGTNTGAKLPAMTNPASPSEVFNGKEYIDQEGQMRTGNDSMYSCK